MSKEMYISSSPHETKVAVLEDDQLVEVYFERDTDVGLVGGIYKGRVSRVLPGMQSAFVDIGLERDAFLYVSDFFYEDQEEYDKVFEEAEARATKFTTGQNQAATASAAVQAAPEAPAAPVVETPAPVAPVAEVAPAVEPPVAVRPSPPAAAPSAPREPFNRDRDRGGFDRRGRRRRHRGRHGFGEGRPGFGEGRPGERRFPPPQRSEEPPAESHAFEILPGESLAKYAHGAPSTQEEPGSFEGTGSPGASAVDNLSYDASVETSQEAALSADDLTPLAEGADVSAAVELPTVEASASSAVSEPLASVTVSEPTIAATAPVEPATAETTVQPVEAREDVPKPVAGETSVPAAENLTAEGVEKESPAPVASEPAPPAQIPIPARVIEIASAPEPAAPAPEASSAAVPIIETPASAEVVTASAESAATEPARIEISSEAIEAATEGAESTGVDEGFVGDEDLAEDEFEEELEDEVAAEGEIAAEGAPAAEVTAASGSEASPAAGATPTGDGSGNSGAPDDRKYTLREPNQRPRFAPRRRRGRRGPGGGGSQRRPDRPRESSRAGNNHPVQIAEVLKEGQEILVQIAKEPLGTKGARITSHVALPGRYLVYMPTIEHIGVSRKIASEEERLRLRNIILEHKGPLTGGFIVRTAGQGRSEEEFKADLKFLSTLWADIRSKSERMKAPAMIHRDLDLVQRLLRDLLTPDFKCVRVDSEVDYERVLDFVNRCQPALVGKVKLYSRDAPLYEEFGIQAELDKALKPKVWLKSGGYIVINQTEALVAVDVNTGKYVGKTNRLEDTIVKTNVDAVNEIVRQVRLRDLGGIIVIDFIDMDERKNRAKVVQALEEALRSDRAPTKVISFHDFGLVAVTRKRVKQSLERTLCEPCEYCTGAGWVKSVNTVCNEILAEAKKMAKGIDGNVLTLRVNPGVAKALKSREGGLLAELELLTKKDVIVKSDPMVHQERFEIF